jgi:hypothetical protein
MTLQTFTTDFRTAQAKLTNESGNLTKRVLTLCRIVADAKATLSPDDFILFKRHNGFTVAKDQKRCAQMVKIGKAADTLQSFAESLPPAISALFHLARLDRDALTGIVRDGQVNSLTPSEAARAIVQEILPRSPRGRKEKVPSNLTVTVSLIPRGFDGVTCMTFLRDLNDYLHRAATRYGCVDPELQLSVQLKNLLRKPVKKAA